MRLTFPLRIVVLCALSGASILAYTIIVLNVTRNVKLEEWLEKTQPMVNAVYSMLLTRANLASHDVTPHFGDKLDLVVHVYAISWIIGFSFFILLMLTSLFILRDYYVVVSLPRYPKGKVLIDHLAWKWGGILGCWAGATYGGELNAIISRTLFSIVFIPSMFYFILAFFASLLAQFRFRRQEREVLRDDSNGKSNV